MPPGPAAFDPLLAPGARDSWKSHDHADLPDALIDRMVDAADQLPTGACEIFSAQPGGAAGRLDPGAMAYALRATRYTMNIRGRWQDPSDAAFGPVQINPVPERGRGRILTDAVLEAGTGIEPVYTDLQSAA